MNRSWRKIVLAALAPLALVVGCERMVESPAEPALETRVSQRVGQGRGTPVRTALAHPAVVQGIADFRGGVLRVGGHTLTIPAHAVSRPTLFRMEVIAEGFIHVDLQARERDASGAWVVEAGKSFRRPLKLVLSYDGAEVVDEELLYVAWARDGTPGGTLVRQPGAVDRSSKGVVAILDHFSGYIVIGGNRSGEVIDSIVAP